MRAWKNTAIQCMAVLFLVSACSTVPITGRRQLSLVPQSQLIGLSAESYTSLLSEAKLSRDRDATQMVLTVGKRISVSAEQFMRENGMHNELANYRWEFNLIDEPETVNAFCMPGGKVAVYSGMLPVAGDETGLAVVIGHEVAHAMANHGGERMSQSLLVQLGGMTLTEALKSKPAQTQQIFLSAYGLGAQFGVLLPYSRGNESEADRIGLILMARAGYDPHAAVSFWERMKKAGGANPPEFLSTHPSHDRRIDDIKKDIPEAEKYRK